MSGLTAVLAARRPVPRTRCPRQPGPRAGRPAAS